VVFRTDVSIEAGVLLLTTLSAVVTWSTYLSFRDVPFHVIVIKLALNEEMSLS
jgi:hypothetical protein